MKALYISLFALLIPAITLAQSPDLFNYQGVARNSDGDILENQNIGVRIDIRQTSPIGTISYGEVQTASTNDFGLFTLQIGDGTPVTGTLGAVDWSNGPYFLEVSLDETGGTNYQSMGVSQLLSVPYAMYAETAGSGLQGPTGPTGAAGTNGTNGSQGPAGPTGPQGPTGTVSGSLASSVYVDNQGLDPADSAPYKFIGTTATFSITASQQTVIIHATKGLGSTVGADGLRLSIGYRPSGSTLVPIEIGDDYLIDLAVPAGTKLPFSLSKRIYNLPVGTYEAGLIGYCQIAGDAANWNNNTWSRVLVEVFNP